MKPLAERAREAINDGTGIAVTEEWLTRWFEIVWREATEAQCRYDAADMRAVAGVRLVPPPSAP